MKNLKGLRTQGQGPSESLSFFGFRIAVNWRPNSSRLLSNLSNIILCPKKENHCIFLISSQNGSQELTVKGSKCFTRA